MPGSRSGEGAPFDEGQWEVIGGLRAGKGHDLILISEGPPALAALWGGDFRRQRWKQKGQCCFCNCPMMRIIVEEVRSTFGDIF